MNDKFNNKYRIPSAGHPNWDYRWNAAYFITICTKNREHYFGKISNGKMHLSNVGVIADLLWHEIKNHLKTIKLGEFVVMPNHIHGILILNNENYTINKSSNLNQLEENRMEGNGNGNGIEGDRMDVEFFKKISPKSNSISTIIRSYKSDVTKHANRLQYPFAWQTRFHDHIIRDDKSFERISNYIKNNQKKWDEDKFYN